MKLNKNKLYSLLDALEDQRCQWEKGLRGCNMDCPYRLGEDCVIGALEEAITLTANLLRNGVSSLANDQ